MTGLPATSRRARTSHLPSSDEGVFVDDFSASVRGDVEGGATSPNVHMKALRGAPRLAGFVAFRTACKESEEMVGEKLYVRDT